MIWLVYYYTAVALAAPSCYTLKDVQSSVCVALCKHEGADVGEYSPKHRKCVCGYTRDFDEVSSDPLVILPPLHETRTFYWKGD